MAPGWIGAVVPALVTLRVCRILFVCVVLAFLNDPRQVHLDVALHELLDLRREPREDLIVEVLPMETSVIPAALDEEPSFSLQELRGSSVVPPPFPEMEEFVQPHR